MDNSSFESILDRIIEMGERNLDMQREFLTAIHEVRGRFDMNDRDHSEAKDQLKVIMDNTFDTVNTMKQHPNVGIQEQISEVRALMAALSASMADIGKNTLEVAESYKWVKRILGIIGIIITAFSIITGMYMSTIGSNIEDKITSELEKIRPIIRD